MYSKSLVQFVFFAVSVSSKLPGSSWNAADFQKTCSLWGAFNELCSSCLLNQSAELPTIYKCQYQTGGSQTDGQLCCSEGDHSCGKTSQTPPIYF
ncbi:hypothetical protein LY78DRAFT_594614 [Colletotrichum sublineola]|nr:hypothetical protein LY78DRAFT_594614 [Colletotrichum sublineola]